MSLSTVTPSRKKSLQFAKIANPSSSGEGLLIFENGPGTYLGHAAGDV